MQSCKCADVKRPVSLGLVRKTEILSCNSECDMILPCWTCDVKRPSFGSFNCDHDRLIEIKQYEIDERLKICCNCNSILETETRIVSISGCVDVVAVFIVSCKCSNM